MVVLIIISADTRLGLALELKKHKKRTKRPAAQCQQKNKINIHQKWCAKKGNKIPDQYPKVHCSMQQKLYNYF